MLGRSLSARPRRVDAEERGCSGALGPAQKVATALPLAIQAPRLRLELLEQDAELLAACATAAQTLLASVDKVRRAPSPPAPSVAVASRPIPSWAVAVAPRLCSTALAPTASRSATGQSRGRGRLASRSRSCTSTRTCTCCSLGGTVPRSRLCCRESRLECVSEGISLVDR